LGYRSFVTGSDESGRIGFLQSPAISQISVRYVKLCLPVSLFAAALYETAPSFRYLTKLIYTSKKCLHFRKQILTFCLLLFIHSEFVLHFANPGSKQTFCTADTFVTVLSVSANHEHRHCAVRAYTRGRTRRLLCTGL
jgi:hypothetical protein